MSGWGFIDSVAECSDRLDEWARFNRGGISPPPLQSAQRLPDNQALDRQPNDPVEIWVPLVVDGERQRDENGRLIRVRVISQVSGLGKGTRQAMRADRLDWPEDVDRMCTVLALFKKIKPGGFRLLCLNHMTNYANEHMASMLRIEGTPKTRVNKFMTMRHECHIAVMNLWNGMAHQMSLTA